MKKKLSIHDIAKQLQVSATTVSFVLNGKAAENRISADQEKRILDHVQEVGYHPNLVAKNLRTGKSRIIAMLVEDISDSFFAAIARVVEQKAYKHGYRIFYSSTENNPEKTKALIRVFRERQVDGYIMAPPPGVEKEIRELIDHQFPVVLFDRYLPGIETVNVLADNFSGAFSAVQHLLGNGYTRIGFVTLDSGQTQMNDRLKGYREAMSQLRLELLVEKVPYGLEQDGIVERIRNFIRTNPKMEAVLFATNYLATPGLLAISELQLQVPGDLAVVSFDDIAHFTLFSPSITAVAQPLQAMSEEVVRQLIRYLSDKEEITGGQTTVLPTKLIVRNSSQPRPGTIGISCQELNK